LFKIVGFAYKYTR